MSNGNKKNLGTTLYFSQFGGERPIPDTFVAAMERAEERTSGYAANAEIPQSFKDDPNVVDVYFDPREQRTNEKVLVVIRKKSGNIVLRDFRTTDQGQTVQVDSTLFYTADSTFVRSYPSATQDVAIKDLGNRWSIQEVAVSGKFVDGAFVPELYQGIELTTRREDPLPNSVRAGLPVEEVQSIVEGTVAQPTLSANDTEARERQIGQDKKLLSRLSRDAIALPVVNKASVELTDLLPPRFRGLIPTTRTTTVANGTVAPPTLGVGELLRSEEQFTALVKLIEVTSRSGVTFPIAVSDTATTTEYGGGLVIIGSTVAVEGTLAPEEGEGVVSSKVTKLGEGHEIRESVTRYAGAWPILPFSRFNLRLQIVESGTKQVVAKGSTTPSASGGIVTTVEEIDGYRERKIVTTQPLAEVDAYVRVIQGNNTNVDVPPQLDSLVGNIDLDGGAGSYSETGTYALGAGSGVGSIQLRGNAEASASALPDLGWIVKIPKTSNVPCVHVVCLVALDTSRASIISTISGILTSKGLGTCTDWPDFRPQPITAKTVGGRVSIQVQVSASAHDAVVTDYLGAAKFTGWSRSSGTGLSYNTARVTKTLQIPATVHGVLSISGTSSVVAAANQYAARGVINGGAVGAQPDTGIVYCGSGGSISLVSSTSATVGDTSIPSSGKRVHRFVTEIDSEYPRLRVFAEVVDFADIHP